MNGNAPDRDVDRADGRTAPADVARVLAFRPPWMHARRTRAIGVALACAAMGTSFIPLWAGLVDLRRTGGWLDEIVLGEARGWAGAALALLAATAGAMHLADRTFDRSGPGWMRLPLALAALLGLAAVGIDIEACRRCLELGLGPRSGTAGSIFFGLTGLGLALTFAGAFGAAWMCGAATWGSYHRARPSPCRAWVVYFDALTVLTGVSLLLAFAR